ncbi:YDG domain-containing protein, partial [uncultured Alistipes sp.]|uniref:YDG domain-containing protein n=1 Tax=uncultured Alistipes sp. TaxID=538949 RepID=UPI0026F18DF7
LTGTVTVKKCNHTGEGVCEYTPNEGAETHAMTCLACGYAGAAESCAYSDDYGHDETNHWQTCTLCGGKKTEAHGWVHQCTSATGIIRRSCDKCEIETVVGTVSITPDFSVTYGKTGSATLVCTAELADGYSLEPADSADNCWVLMALSDGKSWNLGRELEVKLPADLPAGEYWYNASPRLSYQGNNTIVKRFNVLGQVTVTPAPLTVTGAAAKDRTYDGTNSVQITGVTLDGILNGDDVSVDTTGLTGTLNGSDAETYTSVTLPRLTLTGGAASNYTLPQSMGAVPASVTISKATLTATGATVASKTYDGNTAASVSSVTFTGLVPGEALALGTDYTATGTFADANAGTGKSVSIAVTLKDSAKANNYNLTNGSVNATGTIAKASSSITTAPSATGITYGQALSDSTLTGGTGSVPGAFAWTDSTAKPNAGTAQFEVTFTPTDTNYNSTTTNVSVTVAKATPTLTAPTATAIQYGQKLTDSALTGGTATNPNGSAAIAGSWHWASGNTQPTATGTFPVSFAPSDTANYNTPANVDTSVTVNPAAPKISLTVPAYQVAGEDVIVTCTVENPHDATFKEGIPENITLTYQIGSGTPQTITNGKFSIPAGTKKDTVITVTASTDAVNGKYTAATKTATVTVTDKIPVEISGISVTGRVYNGQPVNYTGTPVVKKLDGTVVTDALVSYTWSSVTAPVNAGDYSLVVAVGGGKYIGSTTIPVVIEQAEIRVTAPSKTIYVGETAPVFSAADCNITGLVQGENLKTPPTVAYAEAPDTSKTGSVTVTASGAEVPEGGNYKDRIVYENGTLTITSKPLPPAKYTVTVQAGTGGTASASPTSAEKGTKITLNATPDGGYHFKEWQVISGGVTISNNSFTMPAANVTVKAMFEKDGGTTPPQPAEYSVTFDGNGGTSPAAQTTTGG